MMAAMTALAYRCVACAQPLSLPEGEGTLICACGHPYRYTASSLRYDADALLYRSFRKAFLLNKALNNNGFISYHMLPEGSLSLSDRPDVAQFREYIQAHASGGRLLDVGCGMLELPGYLDFGEPAASAFDLVGLDPIADGAFRGTRIIGCSEFMPFADGTFETLVFATSLDHVCSLEQTLKEARRVLKPEGRILIWMSDRHLGPVRRLKDAVNRFRGWWRHRKSPDIAHAYQEGRYVVYPGYQVLYVPRGGIDPFHSYHESPRRLIRLARKAGLGLVDMSYHHRNLVFLCLKPT